jgi:hypothetical protein
LHVRHFSCRLQIDRHCGINSGTINNLEWSQKTDSINILLFRWPVNDRIFRQDHSAMGCKDR